VRDASEKKRQAFWRSEEKSHDGTQELVRLKDCDAHQRSCGGCMERTNIRLRKRHWKILIKRKEQGEIGGTNATELAQGVPAVLLYARKGQKGKEWVLGGD